MTYMRRQVRHSAGVIDTLLTGGQMTMSGIGKLAMLGSRYMVAIPTGAGLALGLLASKLTTPVPEDIKATEKRLELSRIMAMTAENRRRIEAERKRRKRNTLNGTLD